jgi:hypothetical protein
MRLRLRSGRDWAAGVLDIDVHFDTFDVHYLGRRIAAVDRSRFRAWLADPAGYEYMADDAVWVLERGDLLVTIEPGALQFVVSPESVGVLVRVI